MKEISLFKPYYRVEECLREIRECLEKGWTGLGYKTVKFEEDWKAYTGLENAHFLNSNTSGLHLAINILKEEEDWNEESEIITTPITFISTNHAILYEKLKPVFADVDEYLTLDPIDVKKKITKNTKAIMFVGIGGNTGKLEEIVSICKEFNLKLILDAAHMSGTRYNGQTAGKEADVIIYSFQAVKNLPTCDSGMICFKKKKYDDIARKKSWLGINKDTYSRATDTGYKWLYDVEYIGYKYNGNSIAAAIGIVQLKYLDVDNAYRRQLSKWYDDELLNANVGIIPVINGCESSRHFYQIYVDNREDLILELNKNNINPGVHYRDNTEYKMYQYASGTCPNAHKMSNKILSLPLHNDLTKKDVSFIAKIISGYGNVS